MRLLSFGIAAWASYYLADFLVLIIGPIFVDMNTKREWTAMLQSHVRPVTDVIGVALLLVGFVSLLNRLGRLLTRLQNSADALQLELVSRDSLEAELKTAARSERALREAKSEFLLGLSHELQTPLNGILGLASLLANTELDDEQRRLLNTLDHSAQSMLNRVSDVLDLSLLENDRVELRSAAFLPCETVRTVVGLFEPLAGERNVELSAQCVGAGQHRLIGDPGRVRQILTNLVSNAVKYTSEGSVSVSSMVEPIDQDHARLTFTVTDTGQGMNEAELAAAMQTHALRTGPGAGVGLAICWRLARLMDGALEFESTPTQGTTARARLTLQIEPTAADV